MSRGACLSQGPIWTERRYRSQRAHPKLASADTQLQIPREKRLIFRSRAR